MPEKKVEHLVVDTTAFVKNKNIQDIASEIYTVQGVVDEIKNKRQLRRLVVLPYDLKIKDVFPENIKFVTDFSKKTGDYPSLSAIDIQVLALTYQLEKEHVGTEHLKSEPIIQKVVKISEEIPPEHKSLTGFYMPSKTEITPENQHTDQGIKCDAKIPELKPENLITPPEVESTKISKEELGEEIKRNLALEAEAEEVQAVRDLEEALRKAVLAETPDVDVVETGEWPNEQGRASDEEGGVTSDSDDSDIWDDTAWITPENIDEAKRELQGALEEESVAKVACITGDFAMQNVLRQMGIKAIAADGRIIKKMRTFIYRCYSCNKTSSKLELLFCPFCGNRTLRKAAVFLKADGSEEVQAVWRKPPTGRGKKFSLPKPQGGKHANNPLLCPDQRIPQQRATKLARTRNDPLDPDYIAGFSPFIMRDITSRSAVLGIRSTHTQVKNWMRRNPNEVVKRGKGKKKK